MNLLDLCETVGAVSKKSYSVYLDEDRVAKANAGRVKREFDGKLSNYLDELLRIDVENAPPPLGDKGDVLLELARHYHPTLVDDLAAALKTHAANQPRAIMRLLDAALDAITRGVDLTKPVALFSSEQQMAAYFETAPRGPELIARLRDFVNTMAPGGAEIPSSPVGQTIAKEKRRRAEAAAGRPGRGSKPLGTDGKGGPVKN